MWIDDTGLAALPLVLNSYHDYFFRDGVSGEGARSEAPWRDGDFYLEMHVVFPFFIVPCIAALLDVAAMATIARYVGVRPGRLPKIWIK